jgi:multidrug efflux system membrane fusion protein
MLRDMKRIFSICGLPWDEQSGPGRTAGGAAVLLALVLAAGLPAGCSDQAAPSPKQGKGAGGAPVPVLAGKVVEKSAPVQITAVGNAQPYTQVAIRAQITGQLSKIHFQEGQTVKRGDLLFTIDARPAQANLDQVQANLVRDKAQLENAQVDFDRQKKLFDSKISSREDYDKAQAALDALRGTVLADQAAITNAALNLEFTSIRAPMEGRTGNVMLHEGNIVKAETDILVEINQVQPIFVSFSVPEQYLSGIKQRLREGPLKARTSYPGMEGPEPEGSVSFLNNMVDATTGTIQLKAVFSNGDNALWPGQFVQVTLTLQEQLNAVVAPAQAVQIGQAGEYVFVIKADQTVDLRPIKTGATKNGESVIQSGLKPGETVVTDGQLRLVSGSRVDVKSADVLKTQGTASTPAL